MLQRSRDYNLVFQGPRDSSPETLRKLKRTFVSDLRYSVEQTRKVFEQAPVTIEQAKSAEDLKRIQSILNRAGGEARILEPDGNSLLDSSEEEADEQNPHTEEIEFELDELQEQDSYGSGHLGDEERIDDTEMKDEVEALLAELHEKSVVNGDSKEKVTPFSFDLENRVEELGDEDYPAPIPLELDLQQVEIAEEKSRFESTRSEELQEPGPIEFASNGDELEIPADGTHLGMVDPQLSSALEREETPAEHEKIDDDTPSAEFVPLHQRALAEVSRTARTAIEREPESSRTTHSLNPDRVRLYEENILGKLRSGFQSDLSLGILLGLLLLSLGNWIFLFSSGNKSSAEMKIVLPEIEQPYVEEEVLDEVELISFRLQGSAALPKASLTSEATVTNRLVDDISVVLTSEAPPEPTPEQIVHNIILPPWLSKIVAHDLEITHFSGGRFQAVGTARAFVEDGDMKRRLAVDVSIKGALSLRDRRVHAQIIVKRGDVSINSPENFIFTKSQDGEFKILVKQTLDLFAS